MKRIKKTLTLVSMAVLLLTACEAPKELGVVPYPQYAQTTSKTVELPSTVTFSTNLAKSDKNDLLAYLPDFAIPMKLVDKNPFVTIEITDATDNPIAAEGYNLTVSKQGVNIRPPPLQVPSMDCKPWHNLPVTGRNCQSRPSRTNPDSPIVGCTWMFQDTSLTRTMSRNK